MSYSIYDAIFGLFSLIVGSLFGYETQIAETMPSPPPTPPAVVSHTIRGEYKSVRGVMDPLSCYCFNAGYVTSDTKRIPVCFKNDDEKISCKQLLVRGNYTTKTIQSEPTNPCPAGKETYLEVASYVCEDMGGRGR